MFEIYACVEKDLLKSRLNYHGISLEFVERNTYFYSMNDRPIIKYMSKELYVIRFYIKIDIYPLSDIIIHRFSVYFTALIKFSEIYSF